MCSLSVLLSSFKAPGLLVALRFSACNVRIIEGIRKSNKMAFCPGEDEAYTKYVTNLVSDLEEGTATKDDLLMILQVYAGDSELTGTHSKSIIGLNHARKKSTPPPPPPASFASM